MFKNCMIWCVFKLFYDKHGIKCFGMVCFHRICYGICYYILWFGICYVLIWYAMIWSERFFIIWYVIDVSFLIDPNNDDDYKIRCCGVIESISFVTGSAGTFDLQVWDAGTGTVHTLLHSETITAGKCLSDDGSHVHIILLKLMSHDVSLMT